MDRVAYCISFHFLVVCMASAANWPAWRGPQGMGVTTDTNLPLSWSTNEHVKWRVPLPDRGNSTPIVWADKVFITQAIEKEGRRLLMCFDRKTGKSLWDSGVSYKEKEPTHPTNPYCSASPVTDGERVIASFGSTGLFCYDMNGKEQWHRDLGKQHHIWGNAASPIIWNNLCIINVGPGENTALIAMDKTNGKDVWRHDETGGHYGEPKPGDTEKQPWIGSWSTPVVIKADGSQLLIMSWPKRVQAYEPATGKELWSCKGLNPLVYTSPLYSDGIVVAMGGFGGSALAVKTDGTGDVTSNRRLWFKEKNRQRIGSGVISQGHIYILTDPGLAECIDLQTGKTVWEERLKGPGKKGDNWSSMVLSGDRLYAVNQSGDAFVLRASTTFEPLATNSVGETTMASLAPADSEIFLRSHRNLWCFANK